MRQNIIIAILIMITWVLCARLMYLESEKGKFEGKYTELHNFKDMYLPAEPVFDTIGPLEVE